MSSPTLNTPLIQYPYPDLSKWKTHQGYDIFAPQIPQFPQWQKNSSWDWLHPALKSVETKVVYVGPDQSWWDLHGPLKGRQGVVMQDVAAGFQQLPFVQLFSEGPYMPGAELERVDIKKREFSIGIIINPNSNSQDRLQYSNANKYRMVEAKWWKAWSRTENGWLGVYTRWTGWRWCKVVLSPMDTTFDMDPAAFGNNGQKYDLKFVACDPYYHKPSFSQTWINTIDRVTMHAKGDHVFTIANRGTAEAWASFLVDPGKCFIQDGMTDRMVEMPPVYASDGYMMVQTDPNERTVVGANDPVDNAFYRFIRQAALAEFFLHDIADQGEPIWMRWTEPTVFMSPIPPYTVANIRVTHDQPNAAVTCIMPQAYETGWS